MVKDTKKKAPTKAAIKKASNTIARNALAEVQFRELMFAMLNGVCCEVNNDLRFNSPDSTHHVSQAMDILYSHVLRKLANAYRNLMMWGNLLQGDIQKEATKIALERFCGTHTSVIEHITPGLRVPCKWEARDEEEIRALMDEIIAKHKDAAKKCSGTDK